MGSRFDTATTFEATALNARRLLGVRLLLLALLLVMLPAAAGLSLDLPNFELVAVIVVAALASLLTWHGSRRMDGPDQSATERAITLQLVIDVFTLSAVLYLSGGWTNPLVSLYLVPVAVAAVTLPAGHTWTLSAVTVAAYTVMTQIYRPLFHLHGVSDGGFSLHVTGMWLTFVIATVLIAYFGTSMAGTLRRRDRALAQAREKILRNEQIIAVATLAAGTAHELSTPLASIAVIASELEATTEGDTREDVRTVLRQVEACRDALQRLRSAAVPASARLAADQLLEEIHERFALLRPTVALQVTVETDAAPVPNLIADPTLRQAILNLLDNAADVSPHNVTLTGRWHPDQVEFDILDRGPGLRTQARGNGMGMGLLLANASIERLGGSVYASPREGGGTQVRIVLPAAPDEPGS